MSLGALHVVKQTNKLCKGSVIFLHGSGETGQRQRNWIKFLMGDFALPHIKFYFPTAPLRPYTPLEGGQSNVWFDRYGITPDVPEHQETIKSAAAEIKNLIGTIVEEGVPLNKIILGGFSMGGALALHTAYRFTPGLAGVFTLSSFLNNSSAVLAEMKFPEIPLYMCHGDKDDLIPIEWGQKTFRELTNKGVQGEFTIIKNISHEIEKNELKGLFDWIQRMIPPP